MKLSHLLLLCCLLVCIVYSACNQCKPEGPSYYSLKGDAIPYDEGDAFQMQDSTGRVIHFLDTIVNSYTSYGEPQCDCCDPSGAATFNTAFSSDSAGFTLEFREMAASSENYYVPDIFTAYIDGYGFHANVMSSQMTEGYSTPLIHHATFVIRGTTYSDVYELSNGLSLPTIGASKIWYSTSIGLLKIAFTDGYVLEI